MKKIFIMLFLIVSAFSFAETKEKSAEEIMNELREKIERREEEKVRQEQEKIKQQEEIKKQEQLQEEIKKKDAEKLMNEKRRQLISEPLVDKYGRAEDKSEAYQKALKIAESRMSFVKVKEDIKGEDTLSKEYNKNISKSYEDVEVERQKILKEKEKIQKQLKALDDLEEKVKDW